MTKLKKFRELTWPERRIFFLALALLPMTALGLRLFGFRRTHAALTRAVFEGAADDDSTLLQARNTARMVAAAARYGPYRASCVPLSLTLQCLLRRRRIETDLRLGVSKVAARLEAHAWVEYQGVPLIEDRSTGARFASFKQVILPAAAAPCAASQTP